MEDGISRVLFLSKSLGWLSNALLVDKVPRQPNLRPRVRRRFQFVCHLYRLAATTAWKAVLGWPAGPHGAWDQEPGLISNTHQE